MSEIERDIITAVQKVVKSIFPDCPKEILSSIYLGYPKEKRFGDFSTNVAMRIAKGLKKPPMDIASALVEKISAHRFFSGLVRDIKVEKPGFINFYLLNNAVTMMLADVLRQGSKFGRSSFGKGKRVQIEFVSANPTGPLTVAHGRQAAVGDSLARILQFCKYMVTREYYINDEGVQMNLLARSVRSRCMELYGEKSDFPEDGYKGDYIYEIAKEIKDRGGQKDVKQVSDGFLEKYAYKWIMRIIEKDLEDFGVKFDVWYSQKRLAKSGKIERSLEILKKKGFLYNKDGATWFASTKFGDDKDRVVIKKDGNFTYLTPDIAYHREKFEKGYTRVINIWGPDHHGYVARIKAASQALGFNKDNLSILIVQLVTLYRDRKAIKMSTREGQFITLRQVINEVGKDAARFFFIMRRTDSHLDFDLELAKSKTLDNPVYYIQYAHARIASVIKFSGSIKSGPKDLSLLDKQEEIDIIKKLMQYPKAIEGVSRNLEPYMLLIYLQDLATLFHSYYDSYRIVTTDKPLTKARIALVTAIKGVLSSGLTLLGVSAPEKM